MLRSKMLVAAGLLLVGAISCSSSDLSKGPSKSSDKSDGNIGSIGLKLIPVSGVTINSVTYAVTGTPAIAGTALPSGVLPTPGTEKSFNFGVQVPVGTGYTLSLSAASAETGDDVTCTGSVGPFNITPNNAANISVTLTCRDNSTGQFIANVGVETSACPRLVADYVVAIPASVNVGSNAALNALGHDLDGKSVTYAWSIPAVNASVGSFATAGAQATSFHCTGIGSNVPVTVTMSNGECSRPLLTTINCFEATCGNGVLDPAETCDPTIPAGQPGGGQFGCPADCTVTCGDGIVEVPAEQCELPNGVPTLECTSQCRNRPIECGDGFLQPGEACDGNLFPPGTPTGPCGGATCSSNCLSILVPVAAACGDGIVACGEECEPPSTQTCSDTCTQIVSSQCLACEQNGACVALSDACLNFSGSDRTSCFAVQQCISQTNCGDGTNTLSSCFCGALTTAQCIAAPNSGAGAPAGACAAIIRSAMSVGGVPATNSQVLVNYIDESMPGGAAIARFNCDKADPACITICGF